MPSLTRIETAATHRMGFVRAAALALAMASAALGGGCGGGAFGFDGVELQGGIFDAVGLSGSGNKKLSDTKVEARPGLVLPPSVDKLPDPVTGSIATALPPGSEALPIDPEDRRASNKAELEKRHKAFCERAIVDARIRGEGGVIMGPLGNCQPGLFGGLAKQVGSRD